LAELSDGASVLAANSEARRPERAIDRDIDSFMKNDCEAEKWMMVELSQVRGRCPFLPASFSRQGMVMQMQLVHSHVRQLSRNHETTLLSSLLGRPALVLC
jgi:hypothetical protein